MKYLHGEADVLKICIKQLQNNLPQGWNNFSPADTRFTEDYVWFEYAGTEYPPCFLYICLKNDMLNKFAYIILPADNKNIPELEENEDNISQGLFLSILDKIKLF